MRRFTKSLPSGETGDETQTLENEQAEHTTLNSEEHTFCFVSLRVNGLTQIEPCVPDILIRLPPADVVVITKPLSALFLLHSTVSDRL